MGSFKDRLVKRWKAGISLNIINLILLTIGIVTAIAMIFATYQTTDSFRNTTEITELYLTSQQEAGMLKDLSDGMSSSCRSFLLTGEVAHVFSYMGQYEAALQQAGAGGDTSASAQVSSDAGKLLQDARTAFLQIRETELYAMRLKAETLHIPLTAYPESLQAVELSAEDLALGEEEKVTLAASLIATPEYSQLHTTMTTSIDDCHRTVSEALQKRTQDSTSLMSRVVNRQKILVFVFIFVALLALLLNSFLVLQPMRRSVDNLDNREQIPVRGSYEMRHLARVYNDVLQDNEEKNTALAYTATHDALTGLFNRAAFDKAYKLYGKGQVGVLISDIDHFKHFNDDFGHDVGDRVLQKVAECLKNKFRAEDHVSRIGGDEFCIIMLNMGTEQAALVQQKIAQINEQLRQGDGDLPPITISAGVAFWDRENPGKDIFKDADIALLDVKKHGKTRCGIYSADMRNDEM